MAGADPLQFRLDNLDNERLSAVLSRAASAFQWQDRRRVKNRDRRLGAGIGLACGTEKGSFVAACAEVQTNGETGSVTVNNIVMAFECGAILNPGNLQAQVEGAIIQGLGGALTEEITFDKGRLENGSFAKYRVPRFRDVPRIEVLLINRPDLPPVGAGETPIIAVAPAIGNAVFEVTGRRARSMPVRMRSLEASNAAYRRSRVHPRL